MQHENTMGGMGGSKMMKRHYGMLAVNLGVSLVIMYLAMFAMIWSLGEFTQNLNFLYMALLMWAPMAIVMLLTMGSMYQNKKLNFVLYAAFAIIAVLSFAAIRNQSLVSDRQFLRSMIPHHSGAILMCREASLRDAEIKQLCSEIIPAQQREVDQMKQIMRRM